MFRRAVEMARIFPQAFRDQPPKRQAPFINETVVFHSEMNLTSESGGARSLR